MINTLTFSICVLFQTSSKRLVKKHLQHETGQPHQAKGFISGTNFHNIRRNLDKQRIVDCVKKNKKHAFYVLIDNQIPI